jgi:hypothetical protein
MRLFLPTVHLCHERAIACGRHQPAGLGGPANLPFINLKESL